MNTEVHATSRLAKVPDAEYHADTTTISRSMANVARQSLSDYHAQYVERSVPAFVPTRKMDAASAAHAVILEGKPFRSLVGVYPDSCLKSNGALNPTPAREWEQEQRENGLQYFLKEAEAHTCRDTIKSLRSSRVNLWIEHELATNEQAVFWRHDTGLDLRCKPDWFIPGRDKVLSFDLKITEFWTPSAFRKQIRQKAYWLQEAFYSDGLATHYQMPVEFRFVCVNAKPPHQVAVHHLDTSSSVLATEKFNQLMRKIAEAHDTGNWQDECELADNELKLFQWELD